MKTPGTLHAFKIDRTTQNVSIGWHGTGSYWYAPAARNIVKSTKSHIPGLKSYKIDLLE